MKRILQNTALVLVSLTVSLLLCELVARILLPAPMQVKVTAKSMVPGDQPQQSVQSSDGSINSVIDWSRSAKVGVRLYPNTTGNIAHHTLSKQDVVIRVNSYGLRGPDLASKQPGEYRILFMGDSITFGDYVDESVTIPALLQERLKERGFSHVVVMNAALPGANTSDQYYHYQELYQLVQPDLVLLGMYLNDAQESQKFYAKTLRFPFSASRFLTWLVQHFQLLNSDLLFGKIRAPRIQEDWREAFRNGRDLKNGNFMTSRDAFDFEIYNAHKDFGLAWNPVAWQQLSKISKTFVELTRQNKEKFAAFLFPVAIQIYADQNTVSTYPQEQFAKLFESLTVPHFDLLPTLRANSSQLPKQAMLYDHCHYRAEGNRLVASTVADWLVQEVLAAQP